MARALTVQNAEINTASITIRTLQVEGRQVTMGVFRQLPVENIIDGNSLTLKGVGWGHVNYLMDDSYDYRCSDKTIHLVWQHGNELRRCYVHQTMKVPPFQFEKLPDNATTERLEHWAKRALESSEKQYYLDIVKRGEEERARWQAKRAVALGEYRREERWILARNALVAPLFDLPQLFIAV